MRDPIREKRTQIIITMLAKADKVIQNWTRAGENELWGMAIGWNDEHPDAEIFMGETCDDDYNVNGFMIDDYTFYYKED